MKDKPAIIKSKPSFIKSIKKKLTFLPIDVVFCACDFETTVVESKHYTTAYSIYSDVLNIKSTKSLIYYNTQDVKKDSDKLMQSFVEALFQIVKMDAHNKRAIYFLFHNFSRFDSIFILNYVVKKNLVIDVFQRDNTIYKLSLTNIEGITIEFRDSFLICPLSLSNLAKTLNLGQAKKEFDHTRELKLPYCEIYFKELESYCLNDSVLLMACYINYRERIFNIFKIDISNCLTIAGLSLNIFKTNYYDMNEYPIEHLKGIKDKFVRESYFGGHSEVYRPHMKMGGFCYDFNSLYPYIMSEFDMPIGEGIITTKNNNKDYVFDINTFFGFAKGIITAPENIYIPLLPFRDEKKGISCPTGS